MRYIMGLLMFDYQSFIHITTQIYHSIAIITQSPFIIELPISLPKYCYRAYTPIITQVT